ncbi:MAG: oligosaccharide flippase family protein [Gammaproteobacteria bacterium]|nr:oligosaccharide flippase family protein [Gammaproteobacteria bacterium]MCP4089225.1 oligosaccharide flippase family protein [Gammaproteobacteria bacterium]MCP4276751.1 oligosaccharide flippase family protein [Gammaproteobacteria bacterium]MCP4928403.1 oligosaccharide flippase family protein [Gammaproteobacteria bacterium]
MSGTVISRIIAFAAIPFLSRLFTPADFGVLALFGMVTSTLATLVTWRYEAAIILPERDEDAINILGVCIGLNTITSLILGIIFFYYSRSISIFFGAPELTPWLYWSPLCIWSMGIFTALRIWNSRTDNFKWISIANVGDVGALVITQLGLGLLFRGILSGLILGPYFARISGMLILLVHTLRTHGSLIRSSLNLQAGYKLAVRYARFPLYDLPASLLSGLSREIPTGILGIFFVTQWVGLYSIANRILSVPIQVVSGAIAEVYLPVAQDAKNSARLDHFTLSIFNRLLGISFTPMLVVAIAAPELITVVLGKQWIVAGAFLQALTPSLLIAFIATPIDAVFSVLERQQEKLVFNTSLFVTRLISLIIGGLLGDALFAVIMYSASGTIFWALQCFWTLRLSTIKSQVIFRQIFNEALRTLPFIIFITGVTLIHQGSPRRIVFGLCITLTVFLALRWKEFLGPGSLKNPQTT